MRTALNLITLLLVFAGNNTNAAQFLEDPKHGYTNQGQVALLKERIVEGFIGRWSHDCDSAKGVTISNEKNILIEVNHNQIYISALSRHEGSTLTIFLNEPEDLGRGGMMLDWPNFSKEKSIASLNLEPSDSATFTWSGFFNKEKQRYEWINEPDFAEKQNPSSLTRCTN